MAELAAFKIGSRSVFSMINLIFDDKTDLYFARARVLGEPATQPRAGLHAV